MKQYPNAALAGGRRLPGTRERSFYSIDEAYLSRELPERSDLPQDMVAALLDGFEIYGLFEKDDVFSPVWSDSCGRRDHAKRESGLGITAIFLTRRRHTVLFLSMIKSRMSQSSPTARSPRSARRRELHRVLRGCSHGSSR